MANEIQIFNNEEFGKVRTTIVDGEPWFVLKDITNILGIARGSKVSERLDEDEVRSTYITDSLGRNQNTIIINESGLYAVVMRSDKPIAKPFRKWVTSEVLPSIRKTGSYSIVQSKEDAAALAVLHANDSTSRLIALAEYKNVIETPLLETIEEQKPHVDVAINRIEKKGCYSITDVTKSLGLKTGQITNWAKSNGLIHKTINEVNKLGSKFFKVYSTDGVRNNIGITYDGLNFIKENIEYIKNTPARIKK